MRLFWRVFLLNAALLVAAGVVLALAPLTISEPVRVIEEVALVVGILLLLALNYALLRPAFKPLERLAERMRNVDLLRPGRRLAPSGSPEVVDLVRSFNEMLERLETERRESGRRALAAQESERTRIAAELHDEVGQSMTGVLLLLDQVADEVRRRPARALRRGAGGDPAEHRGRAPARTGAAPRAARAPRAPRARSSRWRRRFTEQAGLELDWEFARELPPLSSDAELAVYRVAQESLTNVARHSGARRVWLSLQPGHEQRRPPGGRRRQRVERLARGRRPPRDARARRDGGGRARDQARANGRPRGASRGPGRSAESLMPVPLVTQILVADDHEIVRQGLKLVLDARTRPRRRRRGRRRRARRSSARSQTDVDLAILDISMPRKTGLQAARELERRKPELRIADPLHVRQRAVPLRGAEGRRVRLRAQVRRRRRHRRRLPRSDARADRSSTRRRCRRSCATTSSATARTESSTRSRRASSRCSS